MAKTKILLVEDNDDISMLVTNRLRHNGFDVIRAKDGEDGFTKLKSKKPDLVITDLAMPKLRGNDLVQKIREDDSYKTLPIIMLSAFVVPRPAEDQTREPDIYMRKPVDPEELIGAIKRLLENSPS